MESLFGGGGPRAGGTPVRQGHLSVSSPAVARETCASRVTARWPSSQDNDSVLNGSVPAYDKEWITAGPRPSASSATCFTPTAHRRGM